MTTKISSIIASPPRSLTRPVECVQSPTTQKLSQLENRLSTPNRTTLLNGASPMTQKLIRELSDHPEQEPIARRVLSVLNKVVTGGKRDSHEGHKKREKTLKESLFFQKIYEDFKNKIKEKQEAILVSGFFDIEHFETHRFSGRKSTLAGWHWIDPKNSDGKNHLIDKTNAVVNSSNGIMIAEYKVLKKQKISSFFPLSVDTLDKLLTILKRAKICLLTKEGHYLAEVEENNKKFYVEGHFDEKTDFHKTVFPLYSVVNLPLDPSEKVVLIKQGDYQGDLTLQVEKNTSDLKGYVNQAIKTWARAPKSTVSPIKFVSADKKSVFVEVAKELGLPSLCPLKKGVIICCPVVEFAGVVKQEMDKAVSSS